MTHPDGRPEWRGKQAQGPHPIMSTQRNSPMNGNPADGGTTVKTVKVELFGEWAYKKWPAAEFLELVAAAIAAIPPEHLPAAVVELDGGGYDSCGSLYISYTRPESDAELAERIAKEARWDQENEEAQRRVYAELKAKYEAQP